LIERQFNCRGVEISGVLQEGEGIPIIALHGWLDNAGSFDTLRHRLPNRTFLALDLAGHGFSGHRHASSDYAIWKDVPEVIEVIRQMGWSRCILMGHSRGAAIATLVAAVLGDAVEALVWIDGGFPMLEQNDFVEQLSKSVEHTLRERRPKRCFSSREQAINARLRSHFKLSRSQVECLMTRGLRQCEEGYIWTSDSRLMDASAVRLTRAQMHQVMASLHVPIMLFAANDASERMTKWRAQLLTLKGVESVSYQAEHHLHMDEKTAASIAADLEAWLAKVLAN